jgi:hypothetical protein
LLKHCMVAEGNRLRIEGMKSELPNLMYIMQISNEV